MIERARRGTEHPLEVLGYSGKTEEHPVFSAVLSFVGSGKKGKDVRAYYSDPPYGWPRDAVDAALIGLFGTGHLRAMVSGTPLKPGQLDQAKVSTTDFRIESATISTRQRLRVRMLFQKGGVDCKPNEEAVAAGEFLNRLSELARRAGGRAPLPDCPDIGHLLDLQSLVGNERLVGILSRHDELAKNVKDWARMGELGEERLPAYERLQSLARHARELDAAKNVRPQLEAIAENRSLIDATNPLPDLANVLVDALRVALVRAENGYSKTYEAELERLSAAESWQRIDQADRDGILNGLHIARVTNGATGTELEVLESVDRVSLDSWRTRTAALPQLFADARMQADKLLEPKTHHVKLDSTTLRTPDEVKTWIAKTEQDLLEQIKQGPVVVS